MEIYEGNTPKAIYIFNANSTFFFSEMEKANPPIHLDFEERVK